MPSIREWPESTRPRERVIAHGVDACSDDELLALLIGGGRPGRSALVIAIDLLREIGGLRALGQADASRLRMHGVGDALIARILAGLELGRRSVSAGAKGDVLDSPEAAAVALQPRFAGLDREQLKVALLNRKHRLVAVIDVYAGNVAGTSVRIGELFTEAIRRQAAAMILAHNHPSGDPAPSAEDVRTTRDAVAAGRLLGIEVVDHLVFGAGRWTSIGRGAGGVARLAVAE